MSDNTLDYIIRSFDETFGQIIVEVTCARHNNTQRFAIDLPISDNNMYPVGEELDTMIRSRIPTWHFERLDRLSAGVANADAIRSLVVPYVAPVIEPAPTEVTPTQEGTNAV